MITYTSGIYKIQSILHPDRIYIGSAASLRHRKNHHFSDLLLKKHKNRLLQAHFNKYGKDDLIFSVLAYCDESELMPINNIIWIEQCFILAFKPSFNLAPQAGSTMGIKYPKEKIRSGWTHTEDAKIKMKKPKSEEAKFHMSIVKTGEKLPHTEEWNRKIGESQKGNKRSPESIVKRVAKVKGRKQSYSEIENRRKSLIGKRRSSDAKMNSRVAQLNRFIKPEDHLKEGCLWIGTSPISEFQLRRKETALIAIMIKEMDIKNKVA